MGLVPYCRYGVCKGVGFFFFFGGGWVGGGVVKGAKLMILMSKNIMLSPCIFLHFVYSLLFEFVRFLVRFSRIKCEYVRYLWSFCIRCLYMVSVPLFGPY